MSKSSAGVNYKILVDAVAEAMLLVDDQGKVMHANKRAEQLLGYNRHELTGLQVEMLMPAHHRTEHMHVRAHFLSKPEKRSMGHGKMLSALTKDGQKILLNIGLSPIRDKHQYFTLVLLSIPDRRYQAEVALNNVQERLKLAKTAAGLGVFDHDLRYKTVQCDERVRELWGFTQNELLTTNQFLACIHPEDLSVRQEAFNQATVAHRTGEYRTQYRVINLLDHKVRWISLIGQVFFEQNQAVKIVGMVQDITEQKQLEQKLKMQSTDLEAMAKHQVASQTASLIAHELNQPLAAISAYSEVAMRSLDVEKVDKKILKHALAGCVAQAQRAGRSLNELMTFLQKSQIDLDFFDLNEVVRESMQILRNDGHLGFHTHLDLEENLPSIYANRNQIQKVLMNLIYNGIEAMHLAGIPDKSITISVKTIKEENLIQVTVQDTGPGLDEDAAKNLFEPFFSTKKNGIGMGLTISRSLIEANGGKLWLDQTHQSGGATFHFCLPITR